MSNSKPDSSSLPQDQRELKLSHSKLNDKLTQYHYLCSYSYIILNNNIKYSQNISNELVWNVNQKTTFFCQWITIRWFIKLLIITSSFVFFAFLFATFYVATSSASDLSSSIFSNFVSLSKPSYTSIYKVYAPSGIWTRVLGAKGRNAWPDYTKGA